MSTYVIGIDLGTTNCTMSYAKIEKNAKIDLFPIPQVTKQGIEESPFTLPSFVFFPLEEEEALVGTYARDRGSELPGRLVSSAKSWLCHELINKRDKFLPLDAEDLEKISPIDALSYFLKHLKASWNAAKEDTPFNEQNILITVPASFDPAARQLVEESAVLAGYPDVILMEEPQAAFYSWLYSQGDLWRKKLSVQDRVMVIDIGGGTTDFSLIEVAEESGNLVLNRLAVGDHLLLGGDNIDLALAYKCMPSEELDEMRMRELIFRCREAKETLLGENAPDKVTIAIKGKGTKLIGGQIKVELTRQDVLDLVIDGFFPMVGPEEHPKVEIRSGVRQIGLPYVQDARISSHIAKFVANASMPTKILFNGGTLKSSAIQERIVSLLNKWTNQPIVVLEEADLDYAVSRGAVNYGLSRLLEGIRIRAGTSRSYYIGIEEAMPAIPGLTPSIKALCVAAFGMEEGAEVEIKEREFALLLGENATFRFFSSTTLKQEPGKLISNWKDLQELHPIETILEKKPGDGATVKVRLKSKVTELGALQLWCVADDERKWKLEFSIRP